MQGGEQRIKGLWKKAPYDAMMDSGFQTPILPVLVVLKNKKTFNFFKSRLKSKLNKQWTQVWT